MQNETVSIDISGTHPDGTFIANIYYEGLTVCAYYPAHMENTLILHEYPDYFTRFVVFYENDRRLHPECRKILKREGIEIKDMSRSGLADLFRKAIATVKGEEGN